ncbi:hypothetical protein N9926_00990 [Flavobacteriaceae bacterium]|nr:hypothetical protein [Flavobacteriaceae bacterium]
MMEDKYTNMERRGLPGGPNEVFTYTTGIFSTEGYKKNSPDVGNPFNVINSGNITMEDVQFPVMGTDNLGNSQMMMPGNDYEFPGDRVFEVPMAQDGKEKEKGKGKKKGNAIQDWWYNLEDVQDKYQMFNDIDNAWLSKWLSDPETKKRLQNKEVYQQDPFFLDIPNEQVRQGALKDLEKLPVYNFSNFYGHDIPFNNDYISDAELNYNNDLQGFPIYNPDDYDGMSFMDSILSLQDSNTSGFYLPEAHAAAMYGLDPQDKTAMGILAHEGVHATGPFQELNEFAINRAFGPQRPYDENLDMYGTVDYNGKPRLGTEYLDEDGLYPRIMDIRRNLGVKPGELITEQMLDDGFDNNDSIQLALEQLSQYYTPEQILKMFNTLASNDNDPHLDKAWQGKEQRKKNRDANAAQTRQSARNFSHSERRADGSIVTIEDKYNNFIQKQQDREAKRNAAGVNVNHITGDFDQRTNWRDRRQYKNFIKNTMDDIHSEADHQYMYKNDPSYRGDYNLARKEQTKEWDNPNYVYDNPNTPNVNEELDYLDSGQGEAKKIIQHSDVDVAGSAKAESKFRQRRNKAKMMNHIFAELGGHGKLPTGYGDEAWSEYVDKYDGATKQAQNILNYEKSAKQVKKGKMSSQEFSALYDSKGWAEYDPKNVKEKVKGLWKLQAEIGDEKKRQSFEDGVAATADLVGVNAVKNLADNPLESGMDVLKTGLDVVVAAPTYLAGSDKNFITGEKLFSNTQGLEDIVQVAPYLGAANKSFKLGKAAYKGSQLENLYGKANKIMKYNPSDARISNLINPVIDKTNDIRGVLNRAPGSKIKPISTIQGTNTNILNTSLNEAIGSGFGKLKTGLNKVPGVNLNTTAKPYTGIGSDFSTWGLLKDKATYGSILGDNSISEVLDGDYKFSDSALGRTSLLAGDALGIIDKEDLGQNAQNVINQGINNNDITQLAGATMGFDTPIKKVANTLGTGFYETKLLGKAHKLAGYNTEYKEKKHGGEHDPEEEINTREYSTPYLGKNLYSSKDQVKEMQSALKDAGFDIGSFGDNKDGVDGILGDTTRKAYIDYVNSTSEYDPRIASYDSRFSALNLASDDVSPLVSLAIEKADRDFKDEEIQKLKSVFERVNLSSKAISQIVGDVDSEWLESAAAGILGTESRLGTYASDGILKADPFDKTSTATQNPYSTMPTIELGDIKKGIQSLVGMDDAEKSLGIAKTKFENIDPEERAFLNITSPQDLLDPQKSIDLTILSLAKRYNRLKGYSNQFPELNMTDDDIKNLAILGHNEGDDAQSQTRFGRYTKDGGYNTKTMSEELHSMRSLFNPDSQTKDFSSSYYKHIPGGGKLFDWFGSESPTYVANVKNYMDQLYGTVKNKNMSGLLYDTEKKTYIKRDGGEQDSDMIQALHIYKDFFNNKYKGNPNAKSAEKLYELLNRKFYTQAKENSMSPANYIMTNMQ